MKITAVRSHPVVCEAGTFLFVTMDTDAGISGVGEAVRMQWLRAVQEAVAHLEGWLVGEDPMRNEALWQLMTRGCFPPQAKIVYAAISAIDMALWDIKGKALGEPVHRLLGGPVRDRVPCYRHNGGRNTVALVEDCKRAVDDGYRFLRFAVASLSSERSVWDPATATLATVAVAEAVRSAIGDEIELCFDAHTKIDVAMAIRLACELEPYRLFFLEDPIRSENPASLATLARHSATPLAAGEQWAGKWEFRQAIEEELLRYVRPDLGMVGGITEALKIAHHAESHYIDLAPHNPNGPACLAASAHMGFACSNFAVLELSVMPGQALTDVFPKQLELSGGHLSPPKEPGLGIVFDPEAAARYAGGESRRGPAVLWRPDGSLNNG